MAGTTQGGKHTFNSHMPYEVEIQVEKDYDQTEVPGMSKNDLQKKVSHDYTYTFIPIEISEEVLRRKILLVNYYVEASFYQCSIDRNFGACNTPAV